jgi:hypothetical protein
LHDNRRALGLSLAVVAALSVGLGIYEWRKRLPDVSDYATYEAHRTVPPAPDAGELRRRGAAACGRSEWQACVDDLDAANALDPTGEDAETHLMHYLAGQHARHERQLPEKPVGP